jgi:hypothetical protein
MWYIINHNQSHLITQQSPPQVWITHITTLPTDYPTISPSIVNHAHHYAPQHNQLPNNLPLNCESRTSLRSPTQSITLDYPTISPSSVNHAHHYAPHGLPNNLPLNCESRTSLRSPRVWYHCWGGLGSPRSGNGSNVQVHKTLKHHTLTQHLKAMGLWVPSLIYHLFPPFLVDVGHNHSQLITQQSSPQVWITHITSLIHTRIPLLLPTNPNHGFDTTVGEVRGAPGVAMAKRPGP